MQRAANADLKRKGEEQSAAVAQLTAELASAKADAARLKEELRQAQEGGESALGELRKRLRKRPPTAPAESLRKVRRVGFGAGSLVLR